MVKIVGKVDLSKFDKYEKKPVKSNPVVKTPVVDVKSETKEEYEIRKRKTIAEFKRNNRS
jgi:hypothetical protein